MIYELDPGKTALVLIDAQQEYFSPDGALHTPNAEAIRDNLVRLRDAARETGATVIHVRHVHKADGSDVGRMGDFDDPEDPPAFIEGTDGVEIIPELEPGPGETVIDKTRFSAFVGTPLESLLRDSGIENVVIAGLMTQYCSVTTARHAHDLDYATVFVDDANAGPDLPDDGHGAVPHEDTLRVIATSLAGGVADVASTDEVEANLRG